jgi:hypothetical protein
MNEIKEKIEIVHVQISNGKNGNTKCYIKILNIKLKLYNKLISK